jgi:hypothetical protein
MKRAIVGAIVGGLLIFIWQTLSWTMLDLHRPAHDYTANQDTIMSFLNANLDEGGYLMPSLPKGTSADEMMKKGEANQGKPWGFVQLHKHYTFSMNDMYMNMGKGLLIDIIMVWMLCWIISKWARTSFSSVFTACIFTGLIVFINQPLNSYMWYQIFDVKAHLTDALAGWGLCGIWLGWWMKK